MFKSLIKICLMPIILIWVFLLCLLLYFLTYFPKLLSAKYFHYLTRYWCRVFVRALDVNLRLVKKNQQAIPKQYILIANHPSALEDFAIPALFDIYPLAKESVRKWIILGRISSYAGTIYVKRDDKESRHQALQSLIDAVNAGKNIVLFPEGGCKGRDIFKEFHTGAFEISLQTGIPILPVYLHYADQDSFEWTNQTLFIKLWQIFKTNNNLVNYYVHDAVYPEKFSDKYDYSANIHFMYLKWQGKYQE